MCDVLSVITYYLDQFILFPEQSIYSAHTYEYTLERVRFRVFYT